MLIRGSARCVAALLLAIPLAVMVPPGLVAAHSNLVTSDPTQGAVVTSPYTRPIVLTFSEHLASGSMADLVDSAGTTFAKAVVDSNAKTMTFTLTTPLAPGDWQVRWVSIADDGDLLRDIVRFTVAPSASTTPTASPVASAATSASAPPSSAAPSAAPSPTPPGAGTTTGSGNGDVILPIIVALIVVGAGAAYLLTRRNRPPGTT